MSKPALIVLAAAVFAAAGVGLLMRVAQRTARADPVAAAFVEAIASGDAQAIGKALDKRPDLLGGTFDGESPLHIAARNNRPDAIEALLERGADLQARGPWEGTALHWACWFGSTESARLLIEKGLEIEDKQDIFGSTPLLWAAHGSQSVGNPEGDYVATVKMLIEHGASADTYNAEGVPAIVMASRQVAQVLQEHGAKVPAPATRPVLTGEVA